MTLNTLSQNKCFGGTQTVYSHQSTRTRTEMQFAVFLPEAADHAPVPALVYLSGLTCTWENFTVKAGAQQWAAKHGIAIIAPDTSPRGADVPDDDNYDMGQGAGFYLNATQSPWSTHFHMEDYVSRELPALMANTLPVDMERVGITGHSMGGHGALTLAIKNPDVFKSLSAFAPIVSPINCPWGQKALSHYLGDDRDQWQLYDSCALVESRGWKRDILIDQGGDDNFLATELLPELLVEACNRKGVDIALDIHPGYDHSYYFISTFMEKHVAWHAERLKAI